MILLHLFLSFSSQYDEVVTTKPIFTEVSFLLIKAVLTEAVLCLGKDDSPERQRDWEP